MILIHHSFQTVVLIAVDNNGGREVMFFIHFLKNVQRSSTGRSRNFGTTACLEICSKKKTIRGGAVFLILDQEAFQIGHTHLSRHFM